MMCHLALVEHDNGQSATWLEPVTDEAYRSLRPNRPTPTTKETR